VTITLSTKATVPMMNITPIQTAAFRSALMPGSPGATAIPRFVFTVISPIVAAGQQASAD
jgi:hypothetical protein